MERYRQRGKSARHDHGVFNDESCGDFPQLQHAHPTRQHLCQKGQNMWLWGSFALALLLTSAVVFIDPIAEVFSLATDFGFDEFVIAFALALSTIVIVEIVKCFQRMYYKNKR